VTARAAAVTGARGLAAALVWLFQYGVVVPVVAVYWLGVVGLAWCWRLCVGAFTLGVTGIMLLVLPVVGWVILIHRLRFRPRPRPRRRRRRRFPPTIWRPWALGLVHHQGAPS
jgi:hypothetical protein